MLISRYLLSEQRKGGGILYQIVLNPHLEVEVEVGEENEEEGRKEAVSRAEAEMRRLLILAGL